MASAGRPELPDGEDSGAFIKSFGVQVKLLRERAGLTQAELGSRVGYGADQIAAVEQGRRIPKPEFIDKADEVLAAGGLLKAMKGEVARARYPAFFRDAARIEASAVEVHSYDVQVINGLLQTEDYAQAMFTMRRPLLDEETVEQRVAARMARQAIFDARPAPLLSFVIEEAVLQRPFGGKPVLRGQLEQLLLIGQRRHVEIQVMPTSREDNAGIDGPFILMTPKGVSRSHTSRAKGGAPCSPSENKSGLLLLDMGLSGRRLSLHGSRPSSLRSCWESYEQRDTRTVLVQEQLQRR